MLRGQDNWKGNVFLTRNVSILTVEERETERRFFFPQGTAAVRRAHPDARQSSTATPDLGPTVSPMTLLGVTPFPRACQRFMLIGDKVSDVPLAENSARTEIVPEMFPLVRLPCHFCFPEAVISRRSFREESRCRSPLPPPGGKGLWQKAWPHRSSRGAFNFSSGRVGRGRRRRAAAKDSSAAIFTQPLPLAHQEAPPL